MTTQERTGAARDPFELQPLTEAGRRMAVLAEEHAADFATRADRHDREGSFPHENYEAMQRSGFMAACVPVELGGLGVETLHDFSVGMNRLARGDGSTAIASNMHIVVCFGLARAWRGALAGGNTQLADALAETLSGVARGETVISVSGTEAGTAPTHLMTEITAEDGGARISGRKIFGTLSPIATSFAVAGRMPDGNGGYRTAFVSVPRDTPGLEILTNWDALGMRASGSHDVVYRDCFAAGARIADWGPWGTWTLPGLISGAYSYNSIVACFLGIAEAARNQIVQLVTTRRRAPSGRLLAERGSIQHTIAEIEVDLAASRAMIERSCRLVDAYRNGHAPGSEIPEELHELVKDVQCTKLFVQRAAIAIVDRALTASGGAGYLSSSPLSRLYRDVRAGPFMQIFSPNEAYEYIGKVALYQPAITVA